MGNTSAAGILTIASGTMASLPTGSTSTANALTMGGLGRPSGTHGSTASAATYTSDVFFDSSTDGILNVTTNTCASSSAVLSGDNSICIGGSSNLVVTITGGQSPYTVVYSAGTVNNYMSGDNIPVSPGSTTAYTLVSVTDNIGCTATVSGTATVTVLPDAAVTSVSGTTPLCIGAMATYTAQGVVLGGGTGSWSSSDNLIATVNPVTGEVTAVSAGTCDIIFTITGGCNGTPSAMQSLTVLPDAAVTSVSGTSPLCIGATATYTASGVVLGGGTGAWSSSNPAIASVDANTGLVTALTTGTTNIIYTITGGCNGTPSAMQSLTVNTVPSALSYTPATNTFVEGTAITPLSPSVSGTPPFTFTVNSLPVGLSIDPATGVISGTPTAPTVMHTYTVTATNSCGFTTTTLTITIDAIPFAGGACTLLNNNFSTNPQLANSNVNGAWYPDRYRPASFVSNGSQLVISINAADGAQLRPGSYSGAFYNTQGRKINQCGGCVTMAKADLYIPADWATNKRRSDLWATAYDGSNVISFYPIIGFRNVTGSNPQMSVWNGTGWNELGAPASYNTSYTLEARLNGANLEYLIDNVVVATYPSNGSVYFGDIIMQAYNFNDNTLTGGSYDPGPNNSYDAFWDNLVTSNGSGNLVTNTSNGNTYCSIQSAVDDVTTLNGHTLTVAAGTYFETVTVSKELTIQGPQVNVDPRTAAALRTPGSGTEAIVNGGGSSSPVFNITVPGVVLNGLEVKNGTGDLISSPSSSPVKTGVIVKFCIVNNAGDEGIQLRNVDGGGVEYCYVFSTTGDGINMSSECTNSYVKFNQVTTSASADAAIYLYDNGPFMLVDNNLVSGITSANGIMIGNKDGSNFNKNSAFSNNAIVSNNTVIGHAGSQVGLYINTSRVDITGNVINDWESSADAALYLRYNIKEIDVTENDISGNENGVKISSGISAANASTILIHDNDLSGTADAFIKNGSSGNVDATCNWFGTANVNQIIAKIVGNVNFVPYLQPDPSGSTYDWSGMDTYSCSGTPVVITATNVTDKLYCVNGNIEVVFSGGTAPYDIVWTGGFELGLSGSPYVISNLAPGTYNVTVMDANGSTATTSGTILNLPVRNLAIPAHYATIQAAINAATAGDVIDVCAGTFSGTITIDKSLTLKGAQNGIDPRPSVTSSRSIDGPGESIILVARNQKAVNINADNVIIDGFQFKQFGGSGNAHTIETDANYSNVSIINNILSSTTAFNAMRLYGGNNFLIQYNYLNDIPGEGIVLRNGNLAIPTAATNQKILDNDIINQRGVAGGAIYVYGQSDLEIARNIIEAKYQGIAVGADGPAHYFMQDIDIHHNDIILEMATTAVQDYAVIVNGNGDNINIHNNRLSETSSNTGNKYVMIKVGYDVLTTAQSNPQNLVIRNNHITRIVNENYITVGINITNSIDAECNYWSTVNNSEIESRISSPPNLVDFIPWLVNDDDINGSDTGFEPDPLHCIGTPVVINSTVVTDRLYCVDGSIVVNFSGGSANYTVAWSGAASGSTSGITGTMYTITGLTNGNYTITVTDANGSTDSEMASVGNLPVRNTTTTTYYATVQAAIDAAATGNVIEICSDLTEGLITINKSIELDGNGFTITSTSPTWGIGLEAQNINIHDIGITGTGTQGIQQGCDAHNLVMTNVTANNCGGTGISIYGSDNCILTNITSTNNNGNGLNITNCDNTTINGITTSGNMFTGGFNAGIGIFTSDVYCLPAGINGLALNGPVSIAEDTKVYSQKGNASHVITGLTGPDLAWAVGIGALDRNYWSSKATAYAVVDALFEAPFNFPNTSVYVVNVPTEVFYVEDNPNGDNTPPMLIQTAINLQAAGGTIQVEPGTFNENVAVNKSLILLGANSNISCGSRTGESLIAPSSGLPFNVTADNVTINGFEITAPTHQYAINGGGTSGLNIRYNDIHNVGNTVSGVNVHAIVYIQPNSSTSNVTISDNCLEDISSTSLTGYSAAAIGVLQSTSTGVMTGLNIERNIINNVHVNTVNWPTGKIAYGIILNVGGNGSYMTNTGKIVDAVINQNEISNLSGHIATAIGMEGNTEDASVTNNLILNLSGTKTGGTRAAGGYDLSGIKFENNKFVGTITVDNNSFATNTFTHSAGSGIGYGVSNYVPQANGGTLALGCNWYGTAVYNQIEDNASFTGRIFNKENCLTTFTPYLTSGSDGTGIGFQPTGTCNGTPVVIASAVPTDRLFCVNGNIVVTFSGGVGPYDIEWTGGSASGVTSPYTISNLAGGIYGITITDANESYATTSATVLNLPVRNTTDNLHYATIQAAINAATTTNGEILEVCAGTYAEDVVVTKSLDIRGPKYGVAGNGGGRGTGEAIVVPATSQSDAVFMIRTNDVSINGFTINGNNSAINTGWTGTNGADIDAFDGVGIYDPANAISVSGAKIENNIIENLAYFGVDNFGWYNYGNPATSGHLVKNNLFRNLGTYGTGSGYDFWGGGVLIYNNNYTRIEGNVMTNVRIGVQTGNFSSANPGIADYQVITNNNIQARRRGIFHNLAYSNASPLTLSNNSVTGLANANETVWDGILLASLSVPASATGNTINGTGISNPSEGIEVWNVNNTSPSVISGGSISNVNTGIFLNNYEGYNSDGTDGAHATISGLTITPNANGIGIRLLDSPSSTAHARVNASVTGVTITGGAEGIKLEQTNAAGAAVGGSFTNNIISAGAAGINVARSALSGTNALTISGNTINHANQMFGGNPAVGISLTNITGTAAATVSNNNISGPLYGYVGYNINTTPSTGISGGTVSGVMQGLALVNTIGGPLASSTLSMSGTTMSGFTGTSANPANNFHAGVYTFTAAPTTPVTGINLTVNNVTIDGTGVPSQASGGIYLADFSTGGVTVQTINVTTSNIINNANRGVDARGRVNLTLTGNTISNNGHTAFGSDGNDGFSVIAQQNAQITATNNFITLPATSTTQAFGLMTGNGTTNLITASSNSILFNGNNFAGSKSAKSDPGTGSINAACNWWGNICPADVVSGNVMIYPFLVDGTDAGGNPVDGFQPSVLCNEPLLSISINGPSGPAINITSGNSDDLTVCSGEEVDFNPVAVVNLPAANCSSLRVQKAVTSAIPNIASSTTDLPYSTASMPPAITETPVNNTLTSKSATFVYTPYYDVNGNNQYDAGTDVAGGLITFTLTVEPVPSISNTVTSGAYSQVMTSGGSYAHAICHNTNITTSIPTLNSTLANACGTLRIQTQYISTLPNIPSATLDNTFTNVVAAGPQTISPENNTGMTQTITFITTPYYDVNNNGSFEPAIDIEGDVTTFVLTVHPIPSGAISGTAFVIQNAPTTANVTFTGSVGTAPYTFTYNVNGGGTQTISTIGMNDAITLPHPNGTPGVFTYTLLSVTDANGCAGVVDPLQDTVVITVIASNMLPDLSPSIARPLNASFTNGQAKEGYVQFSNGGNGPTFGVTTVELPKTVANFNLVINQSATMSAGQSVVNNQCTFTDAGFKWVITYPNQIAVGTNIKIGFSLTATGLTGANGTMTATILNGTGGDSNNFNNKATRRFVIN